MLQNHSCLVCLPMVITFMHESSPEHLSLRFPVWQPCGVLSNGECACVSPIHTCVRVISECLPPPVFDLLSHRSPFIFLSPWEIPRAPFPRLCGDRNILRGCLPHRLHGGHRGGVPHEEHCKETWLWWPTSGPQTEQADPSAPPGNRK